jgi:hypothetical protein
MIAAIYAVMMLAALLVVLTPWSACAECAWVLWLKDYSFNDTLQTGLITAFKTKEECDVALGRHEEIREKQIENWKKRREPGSTWMGGEKFPVSGILDCLPDTVDPRGPNREVRDHLFGLKLVPLLTAPLRRHPRRSPNP